MYMLVWVVWMCGVFLWKTLKNYWWLFQSFDALSHSGSSAWAVTDKWFVLADFPSSLSLQHVYVCVGEVNEKGQWMRVVGGRWGAAAACLDDLSGSCCPPPPSKSPHPPIFCTAARLWSSGQDQWSFESHTDYDYWRAYKHIMHWQRANLLY